MESPSLYVWIPLPPKVVWKIERGKDGNACGKQHIRAAWLPKTRDPGKSTRHGVEKLLCQASLHLTGKVARWHLLIHPLWLSASILQLREAITALDQICGLWIRNWWNGNKRVIFKILRKQIKVIKHIKGLKWKHIFFFYCCYLHVESLSSFWWEVLASPVPVWWKSPEDSPQQGCSLSIKSCFLW